jgi:hypothetical protein
LKKKQKADLSPDYDSDPGNGAQSASPKRKLGNGQCQIKLFSKTYLRGDVKVLTEDAENLDNFDDKTTSIEVRGPCCWYQSNNAFFFVNNQEARRTLESFASFLIYSNICAQGLPLKAAPLAQAK